MVTDETLKHYRNKITYAQNKEDLLLESFFFGKKKGFYVDIGGYDPDEDSVTKLFYLKGWSGINIEPQPGQYAKFVKRRPRDINVNTAIGSVGGHLKLRVYRSGGLSTLSDELKEKYEAINSESTNKYDEVRVAVTRLDEVLKRSKVEQIDFMKIDVEGFEVEVIKSNNWKLYRPHVLCIESGITALETRAMLTDYSYKHVFNDGLNDYYVDVKRDDFHELPFIDHVLIRRGNGIRDEDYKNIVWLFNKNKKLQKEIEVESVRHAKKEEELKNENVYLHEVLNDARALLRKSLRMYSKRLIGRNKES